jgi:hypothetical protein
MYIYKLSHTLSLTHSLSHTYSLSHTFSLTHILSHSHTHTRLGQYTENGMTTGTCSAGISGYCDVHAWCPLEAPDAAPIAVDNVDQVSIVQCGAHSSSLVHAVCACVIRQRRLHPSPPSLPKYTTLHTTPHYTTLRPSFSQWTLFARVAGQFPTFNYHVVRARVCICMCMYVYACV